MRLPIYLDTMATTPVDSCVQKSIMACLGIEGNFGNPASNSHIYGWDAQEVVAKAREQVAGLLHADPKEIIWTSCATESNNLAIQGAARFYSRKGRHIVTCKTEHKSVLKVCQFLTGQGYEITYLDSEPSGLIDLNKLEDAIRDDTVLVSIMCVNNEIGVIQDLASIGALAHARGALLHVDAAQGPGKIKLDLGKMPVDLMSFTAHKVYGPKGVGALFVRRSPRVRLEPIMFGGGHEQGLRPGTLATHQIAGMGEAFRIVGESFDEECGRIRGLRDRLWAGISEIGDVEMNGDFERRVAHNLNVHFLGVDGEALLVGLKDLAVSSGSACTSASIEPSYVLCALGMKDVEADSSIRFSLGRYTTEEEIDYAISHVRDVVMRLRRIAPARTQNRTGEACLARKPAKGDAHGKKTA